MKKVLISIFLSGMLALNSMISIVCADTKIEAGAETNNASTLSAEQLNSIVMLNYLTVLTQSINSSNNSRLYAEEAYNSLISNTRPNSIDSDTQYYLNNLLDTLEGYRMVDVKRERLQYIYEQNMARALKEAVPNPTGLLSGVLSANKIKIATCIAYMVIDSATSYMSAAAGAELEYLKDGWELDDTESAILHSSRKQLFNYMIDTSHKYKLPDELTISEAAVDEFVKWQNNTNTVQRIQFLENNKSTYAAFGGYWLLLAKSYFETNNYKKCLEAVKEYEGLKVSIFRKDLDYAKVLPIAICSAEKVESKEQYVKEAEKYADLICDNTDNKDWDLRYYAAITNVELYEKTNNIDYLKKAYKISLNNVNHLVVEQKGKNKTYLAEVTEKVIPKDADKNLKNDIKKYNKLLKEERKKELAPVYEPLKLNCELLFSIASELKIDDEDKKKIEGLLRGDGTPAFFNRVMENAFSFDAMDETIPEIGFNGNELTIPVEYIDITSSIKVSIKSNEERNYIDWVLSKVDRKNKNDLSSFKATYKSTDIKKEKYSPGDVIDIIITTPGTISYDTITATYRVNNKKILLANTTEFVRIK